jgi:cell division protein FtsQ
VPINKNKIKKILTGFAWTLVGISCIWLLVSAVHSKDAKRCKGVDITITGVSNNFFIDKGDVYAIIKTFGGDSTARKSLAAIDLGKIEHALEKDVWIKNAELFFDNNDRLRVSVEEREPIARVFSITGNTFYIDSSCMMLPLSDKFSARLPVFTGFTSDARILSKADSVLLRDIKVLSEKIAADSFLMAMVDQVDITAQRTFEMVPKIGKQSILFGTAEDADAKLEKLKLFYKDVITKAGWNRYNTIDLQYSGQVVAKIRGQEDIAADSLRTLEIMKLLAEEAARRSADSLETIVQDTKANSVDTSMIGQSVERDEGDAPATSTATFGQQNGNANPALSIPATQKPVDVKPAAVKPTAVIPATKPVVKPVVKPIVKLPVAKQTIKQVIKPTAQKPAEKPKPKPAAKPATAKPPVKKPAAKPTNDY